MGANNLEYGRRAGADEYVFSYPIGASEVFKKKGGAFLKDDSSGRLEIVSSQTNIIGHALFNEDLTASSTEGATKLQVNTDLDGVYEVPINTGTWADTMRGKVCDLTVASSIQGVDLTASTVDQVELIDKWFTNAAGTVVSVLVKLWQKNLTRTGVV